MATHTAMKNPNEPSSVATPMAMPLICKTAIAQHAAASPRVTVSATAPAVLTRAVPTPAGRTIPPVTLTSASLR